MRVAIVHYHLHPGGVTRVIEQSVSALKALGVSVVVLSGEPYSGEGDLDVQVVPELAYTVGAIARPDALKEELEIAAKRGFGGALPDVWHVHNPGLGKNAAMLDTLYLMAQAGEVLLVHVHDFAEDGRPENYANASRWISSPKVRYPVGPRVGYGVLSARDGNVLTEAGLGEESLFLLPNPVHVAPLPEVRQRMFDGRLVIYPARGIRRKNLGEMLLWAACSEGDTRFACSLAPKNPSALPVYEHWKAFAGELGLPALFGVGDRPGVCLPDLVAQADALITTSVAEGFGLAYLESCLWEKPLIGRNLPEVTVDFKAAGVAFPGLYERVPVPLAWLDVCPLKERMAEALKVHYHAYGREPVPVDVVWDAWTQGGEVDFGLLDEPAQEAVIRHVESSPEAQELLGLSLDGHLQTEDVMHANKKGVAEGYSLDAYGERLVDAYQSLIGGVMHENMHSLDPGRVLDYFLKPECFSLLRSVAPKKGLSKRVAGVLHSP